MAQRFPDRIKMTTATTGAGAPVLGSVVSGFRSFAQAVTDGHLASGDAVTYVLEDTGGAWETCTGIYTSGTPGTLTRVTTASSAGGTTAISLSGSAVLYVAETAAGLAIAALTSGAIDGTTIGGTTAAAGTFTTLTANTPAAGNVSTLAATTAFVNTAVNGATTLNKTGGSYTLVAADYGNATIIVTGTLTSNLTLIFPNSGQWVVANRTSGAFTVTSKTAAGTGITTTQGTSEIAVADGTNVTNAKTDFAGATISGATINSTTIGATTASTGAFTTLTATTPSAGDTSTNVATTAFVTNATDGLTTMSTLTGSTTLTTVQAAASILLLTGTLTGNVTYVLPNTGVWNASNRTSGAFTVTLKTASGTGIILTQGQSAEIMSDGTNVVYSTPTSNTLLMAWNGGAVVANGTYWFTVNTPFAGTINSMTWYSGTGTFTVAVQIVPTITGTAATVTGLSAVAVTSTQTTTAASAANTFSAGQVIQAVVSSAASSPTNSVLTLNITRS